jgi:hypothetical protein
MSRRGKGGARALRETRQRNEREGNKHTENEKKLHQAGSGTVRFGRATWNASEIEEDSNPC